MHVDQRDLSAAQWQPQRALAHGAYVERHTLQGAVQDIGADQRDTVAVFRGKQRCVRMIEPDGDIPIALRLAVLQVNQKPCGIVYVGGRIEGFLQRGEGVGVEMQVDLHAADIDEAVVKLLLL
jgi:hypothetical protein